MPTVIISPLLKTFANRAATCTSSTAVASGKRSAEFVSFQRHQASIPPSKNVNSAASAERAARHFSGKYANSAQLANHLHHLLQSINLFHNEHLTFVLLRTSFSFPTCNLFPLTLYFSTWKPLPEQSNASPTITRTMVIPSSK